MRPILNTICMRTKALFALLCVFGLAANNTYGYDVFVDGKLMIHQPAFPQCRVMKVLKQKKMLAKLLNW